MSEEYQIIGLYNFAEKGVRRHVVFSGLTFADAGKKLDKLNAAPTPKNVDVSYYIEQSN